ncbi:MAG: hypothetical protein ABIB71_05705 [Candidatus Woesearchaeota archaeon]
MGGKNEISESYPFKPEILGFGEKTLVIMGVEHHMPFFDEYAPIFRDAIAASSGVVVEYGPEEVMGDNRSGARFYKKLLELSVFYKKDVFKANPQTLSTDLLDMGLFCTGVILVGHGIQDCVKKQVSRRGFLKSAAKIAGGSYLIVSSSNGFTLKSFVSEKAAMNFGIEDRINIAGKLDYRDCCTAEGLELIMKEVIKDKGYVLAVHGVAHTDPMKHYLLHPKERKAKTILYKPSFGILGNERVRRYNWNYGRGWMISGEWEY